MFCSHVGRACQNCNESESSRIHWLLLLYSGRFFSERFCEIRIVIRSVVIKAKRNYCVEDYLGGNSQQDFTRTITKIRLLLDIVLQHSITPDHAISKFPDSVATNTSIKYCPILYSFNYGYTQLI